MRITPIPYEEADNMLAKHFASAAVGIDAFPQGLFCKSEGLDDLAEYVALTANVDEVPILINNRPTYFPFNVDFYLPEDVERETRIKIVNHIMQTTGQEDKITWIQAPMC